jgi:hypothetical protein
VASVRVRIAGQASPAAGGTVSASGTGCPGGTAVCTPLPGAGTVNFTASASPGYVLESWSGCGPSVGPTIPNAGVTCTANFRGLWARTFVGSDTFTSRGLGVTGEYLRLLANQPLDAGESSIVVWNALATTGEVARDESYRIMMPNRGRLTGFGLTEHPNADNRGVVVLAKADAQLSTVVLVLARDNEVATDAGGALAWRYSAGDTINHTPFAITSRDDAIGFVEGVKDTRVGAQFPTEARLVRLDSTGRALDNGITQWCEVIGSQCDRASCPSSGLLQPVAVGLSKSGNYLVSSRTQSIDKETPSIVLNLTKLNKDGQIIWGRHIETKEKGRNLIGWQVTSFGDDDFIVTGQVLELEGASYDAFAIRVSSAGEVSWRQTFGTKSALDAAQEALVDEGRNAVIVTGSAPISGRGQEMFAAAWRLDNGTDVSGFTYGGEGNETGIYLAKAPDLGYYLLGNTTGSFGNPSATSWGMQIDDGLRVPLRVGTIAEFKPPVVTLDLEIAATCTNAGTISNDKPSRITPSFEPITLGGDYQAP